MSPPPSLSHTRAWNAIHAGRHQRASDWIRPARQRAQNLRLTCSLACFPTQIGTPFHYSSSPVSTLNLMILANNHGQQRRLRRAIRPFVAHRMETACMFTSDIAACSVTAARPLRSLLLGDGHCQHGDFPDPEEMSSRHTARRRQHTCTSNQYCSKGRCSSR
ncbi:hypothetical protein BV20DRAFT_676096 [Pilatotrama ljubarskyi]|nr:hypothetical protein BV20DRAFT_676096 [Pilatotrama ljubarskyi]